MLLCWVRQPVQAEEGPTPPGPSRARPAPEDGEEGWLWEVPRGCQPRRPVLATEKQQAESQEHLKNDKRRRGRRRRLSSRGQGCPVGAAETAPQGGPAGPLHPSLLVPLAAATKPLVL